MLMYLLQRFINVIITLFVLLQICFCILFFSPKIYFEHHTFLINYIDFYRQIINGEIFSITDSFLLNQTIINKIAVSGELVIFSLFISLIIGIPLGIYSSINKNKALDKCLQVYCLLAYATPIIWIALLAIIYFSHTLNWLPDLGRDAKHHLSSEYSGFILIDIWLAPSREHFYDLWLTFKHLILPTITLAIIPTAEVIRLMRVYSEQIYKKNYMKAALSRGLPQFTVIHRHLLHNALPQLLTKLSAQFPSFLTLLIAVEVIFDWPGIGNLAISAFYQQQPLAIALLCFIFGSVSAIVYFIGDLISCFTPKWTVKDGYEP